MMVDMGSRGFWLTSSLSCNLLDKRVGFAQDLGANAGTEAKVTKDPPKSLLLAESAHLPPDHLLIYW